MPQGLDWLERVGKAVSVGGPRHELRDSFRSLGADSPRIETALLPDHPGKELNRQRVFHR